MRTAPVETLPERLRAHLGPRAVKRPVPDLHEGLVAFGTVGFAIDRFGDSGSNGLGLLFSAGLLAVSLAVLARGPIAYQPAAVAASTVAVPALAFFLVASDRKPSVSLAAFIAAGVLAALYFVGPSRGHTTHLSVLVVAGWIAAVAVTQSSFTFDPELGSSTSPASLISDIGGISLVVGLSYLLAGWWLDRTHLRGMATPFLGVGAVALPAGAYAFVSDGSQLAGALLGLAAGAAVAIVGAHSRRRGTLWIGLVLVGIAVSALVDAITSDDNEIAVVALVLLVVAGGALAWGARYLASWVDQLGRRLPTPVSGHGDANRAPEYDHA
jgi:hypothetical protein